MQIQFFRFDKDGYYIEPAIVTSEFSEHNPMPDNITNIRPPDGLFRAKFTGTEWIEAGSPPEPEIQPADGVNYLLAEGRTLQEMIGYTMKLDISAPDILQDRQHLCATQFVPILITVIQDLAKRIVNPEEGAAAKEAAVFLFVKMAENGQLDDTDIAAHAAIFPLWVENTLHQKGCLRRCPLCGDVFRCIDPPPVSPQARNSRIPPSTATRFWERVGASERRES
ncbi:MAG: hypothetical protein FWD96_04590 [Defluviitaleaceae bacterium]|nr:hypothetical protein [Defluviitaleaceae bacterium]